MTKKATDQYSAIEQGLGYIYQTRLALLQLLQVLQDGVVDVQCGTHDA